MDSFKDLIAWQKGMKLAQSIYVFTRAFPYQERFGLTSQSRRAAVSIPCNIAEGFGRSSKADMMHFLDMAVGSANELETLLLLAHQLDIGDRGEVNGLVGATDEVRRITKGLIKSLGQSTTKGLRS